MDCFEAVHFFLFALASGPATTPHDSVKLVAPVGAISDASTVSGLIERVHSQIGQRDRLHIRFGVGRDAVSCEVEVAGREDTTLSILNVHVMNSREVADVTSQHYIALVFDGSCLSRVSNSEVTLTFGRTERHEENVGALIGEVAGQFRKFAVVANENTDGAAVGGDHIEVVSAFDIPPVLFIRRGMYLLLSIHRAVSQTDIADVVDIAVGHFGRMASGNDVDVVLDGELLEKVAYAVGVIGQMIDSLIGRDLFIVDG